MPRNIVQDVVPSKRSIRQVPLPSERRKEREEASAPEEPAQASHREFLKYNPEDDREAEKVHYEDGSEPPKKWRMIILWTAVAACLAGLFLVLSSAFSKTTLSITLKTESAAASGTFTASPDGANADLPYTSLPLTKSEQLSVQSDGTNYVESKASGVIAVYNDYSEAPQVLIAKTRFETADGLVYRIDKRIVVPPQKTAGGKKVPGSVEATVYADKPGPAYNIGLSDFTIPGFKDNPGRYAGFYARSKTPMTGGAAGMAKTVSPEKLAAARAELDQKLSGELLTLARSGLPSGSILYEGSSSVSFSPLPDTDLAGGAVGINEQASFTGYAFDRDALAKALAGRLLSDYDGSAVTVPDLDSLRFTKLNSGLFPSASNQTLSFSLSGNATFVWRVDENKLKADLAGKAKTDAPAILSRYPGILKTAIVIRPFWSSSFPSDPGRIEIIPAKNK